MGGRTVVIGVDIGGTKVKAGAVEVGPHGVTAHVAASRQAATPRAAPTDFYDAVAGLACGVRDEAGRQGLRVLPLLAAAHPGRFLPDGALARGTTPNLGSAPGEFDGLRPAQELERRLGVVVVAENDAVAQMRFGLDVLLREASVRPRLVGETVIYLGPGTGMGGGVARVDRRGVVTVVTDGHFFDLQVPGYGKGTRTAEELFTGPAIARAVEEANTRLASPIHPATAGQLDYLLTRPDAPAAQREAAQRIAETQGEILSAIIAAIHAGTVTKVRLETAAGGRLIRHVDEPDRAWSAADRETVREARRVILGGFVGCSMGLGGWIRRQALARLHERGLRDVELFQIPVDSAEAGLLGIVRAIPERQIQECRSRVSAAWAS